MPEPTPTPRVPRLLHITVLFRAVRYTPHDRANTPKYLHISIVTILMLMSASSTCDFVSL
jgi:hypothetical protein